jgi:hypothetical protein
MGSALAAAALDAGRPTLVWNGTPHRARTLGERGATVASTIEEAVSDGLLTCPHRCPSARRAVYRYGVGDGNGMTVTAFRNGAG